MPQQRTVHEEGKKMVHEDCWATVEMMLHSYRTVMHHIDDIHVDYIRFRDVQTVKNPPAVPTVGSHVWTFGAKHLVTSVTYGYVDGLCRIEVECQKVQDTVPS